ncbi:carboxypeptidase-like regulatory domain-containing protein (plasmid) [Methanosphaera sp. ISO3-F5]|uniref:carboxypeptidase-like regulatory domain-containing protein n=1 Tax=Methanosphaera sp. ISO3-F5 TaxID=1452353 RepID=UPI002B25E93C|nr:carboxypeptidase-like regulatory domain-containing protein [Methanosphaera sp. ISO3-F5]WQH65380.1 carboxypeptidase-like regulatory domain-containing protein [Methanosphaera sp. ISO3-F5]
MTIHIDKNTFNKNQARKGSAIFLNETTRIRKEGKYTNNINNTITYITNNIFKQNKAKTIGPVIINKGKNTHMTNNTNMKKSNDSSTIHILQGTNTQIRSNTFQIPKIATKISINTIKQKTYKENMTITGKLTDKTGTILKNTKIKIKVNTKTYTVKTNNKGTYALKVVANKVGTNTVTVTYPENKYYKTITKKTTFKTFARATKITVNKISTTTKGKTVKITGKLTDNLKSPVMNSLVKIKINKKTVKIKTNKQGVYTYNYKTTVKGRNNVTITFPGSTNYKKTSTKTSFIVK